MRASRRKNLKHGWHRQVCRYMRFVWIRQIGSHGMGWGHLRALREANFLYLAHRMQLRYGKSGKNGWIKPFVLDLRALQIMLMGNCTHCSWKKQPERKAIQGRFGSQTGWWMMLHQRSYRSDTTMKKIRSKSNFRSLFSARTKQMLIDWSEMRKRKRSRVS